MNVAAVRGMRMPSPKQRALAEDTACADRQRMNGKCSVCGWRMNNILVGDWKRAFAAHLEGARHTGRNRKRGPQQKNTDRREGRNWTR